MRLRRLPILAICPLLLFAGGGFAGSPADPQARTSLPAAALQAGKPVREVDLAAFAPAADARPPSREFSGSLHLAGKLRSRTVHLDTDFLPAERAAQARSFPELDIELVQHGDALLPARRGYLLTTHPYWDIILEPGRVWDEPGDGGLTRAALPFALVQKQMNCTHYGVAGFLFGDDGAISRVAIQVSSETCHYLQLDLWGMLQARYKPHAVAGAEELAAAWDANTAARVPTQPLAALAAAHPGLDLAPLALGDARGRTMYGLLVDGTHYVSSCPTRHGEYPYCDVLPFPSYSTAKSLVAGLALMTLEHDSPGVRSLPVTSLAPAAACATPAWDGVQLVHLLDMTTGHFDSAAYQADEDAPKVTGFFSAPTARGKAEFSCGAYPRKAEPGSTWVYHSSDTFLLGAALQGLLHAQPGQEGADVFRDVAAARIFAPLRISATAMASRRTSDAAALPFFGYGLQFHRDDMVRLARFVADGNGIINGERVLDAELLAEALQQRPEARGAVVTSLPSFRYQHGFWARDVAAAAGCEAPLFVPFMSGFGGIEVVLFPNGVIYYSVSDRNDIPAFDWLPVVPAVNRIAPLCPP